MTLRDVLDWFALIMAVISIITVIWKVGFKSGADTKEKTEMKASTQSNTDAITLLKQQLSQIEQIARDSALKIEPLWEVIKVNLPKLISVPRSENLVAKLTDDRITDEELCHLEGELQVMLINDRDAGNRVIVDLLALWAVQVTKNRRGIK
jgi:hypothetical protein